MTTSPFKFLDSYTLADAGHFFGRERETAELFRQCFVSPILVVYGGSGTGKTSLVQCGLASRFAESDWLPLPVRRQGDLIASLREAITAATLTPSRSTDLGELAANLYLDHFKLVWFIFDQFEELFIFGGHGESEAFFLELRRVLEKERNARAIFVVREEYLAELTRYERIVPGLIENRHRVERLSHAHAMDVVDRLCAAHGIPTGAGFSQALVERLDPGAQGVELSYLQVFLDRCWRSRQDTEPFSTALLERIGHVDDLLGAFLDEQVADTPSPERAEALLKTFVSDQGTKRQLTAPEAHEWVQAIGTTMDMPEVQRLLQLFVDKRLLKEQDDRGRHELLHDALARQIFQRITRAEQELIEVRQFVQQAHGQYQRRGAELSPNDLAYLRPYRNQLYLKGEVRDFVERAFGRAERLERRRKWRMRAGLALLLGVLFAVGIYAGRLHKRLKAEEVVRQSKELSEKAMETLSGDPWMAYLMAERAYEVSPTFESEKALVNIYPFLYPEVARFKGNGFHILPYSKATLIFDDLNDRVSLYDSLGTLLWEEADLGLVPFSGVEVLDTAGIIILAGKRIVVRKVTGKTLLSRPTAARIVSNLRDRTFALYSDDRFYRMDSMGRWDSVLLDTAGIHASLKGDKISKVFLNDLIVLSDSSVHVFDVWSKDLALLHRWTAPSRLRQQWLVPKAGQCVVNTDHALYHLDWTGSQGLQISTVDFAKEGIAWSEGEPDYMSRHFVKFPTTPVRVYDAEHRTLFKLPGIQEHSDHLFSYDLKKRRFLYWASDGDKAITIRSMDGAWSRVVATRAYWTDVYMASPDSFLVRSHSSERGMSRITCYSMDGDTLWSKAMRTTKQGTDGGWLHNGGGEQRNEGYREVVQMPSLQNPWLVSVMNSDGRTARFLKPLDEWLLALNNGSRDSEYILSYSDSVVSMIRNPWLPPFTEQEDEFLSCDREGVAYSLTIREDKLVCLFSNGMDPEQHFSIDLHGCLDRIKVRGWVSGSKTDAVDSRWGYVYKDGDDLREGIGYLVDLRHRAVIDTGSFAQPARYVFLPKGDGFARLSGDSVLFLDTLLRPMKTLRHRSSEEPWRAGSHLLYCDSIEQGILNYIDLHSHTLSRRILPSTLLEHGSGVLATIARNDYANYVWLDEDGVVYLECGPELDSAGTTNTTGADVFLQRNKRLVAIGPDGHVAMMEGLEEVSFRQPKGQPFRIWLSNTVIRRSNRSTSVSSTPSRHVRYESSTRTFEPYELSDEVEVTYKSGVRVIERNGQILWDLGRAFGTICGRYMYSRFRAVDRYERFPLYGADVIKEVREEKKFGAFWEHVHAGPQIAKVLGTEAENTGSRWRAWWFSEKGGMVLTGLGLGLAAIVLGLQTYRKRRKGRAMRR